MSSVVANDKPDGWDMLAPKEKYLRASDFLEVQIGNIENDLCPHSELVKLIVGLIDLMPVDRVVALCFEYEKQEVLFTSIYCLSYRYEAYTYMTQFIVSTFKESLNN